MEALIFKPSRQKLDEAKVRRNDRIQRQKSKQCTIEELRERHEAEMEVFEYMNILQDRVGERTKLCL